MKAYKIKNIDDCIIWTILSPVTDDEKIIDTRELNEELLTEFTEADKDFIILEFAKKMGLWEPPTKMKDKEYITLGKYGNVIISGKTIKAINKLTEKKWRKRK